MASHGSISLQAAVVAFTEIASELGFSIRGQQGRMLMTGTTEKEGTMAQEGHSLVEWLDQDVAVIISGERQLGSSVALEELATGALALQFRWTIQPRMKATVQRLQCFIRGTAWNRCGLHAKTSSLANPYR